MADVRTVVDALIGLLSLFLTCLFVFIDPRVAVVCAIIYMASELSLGLSRLIAAVKENTYVRR